MGPRPQPDKAIPSPLLALSVSTMARYDAERLDELQDLLSDAATLEGVSSTETHLVLVFSKNGEICTLELGVDEVRRLVDSGLIADLSAACPDRARPPHVEAMA